MVRIEYVDGSEDMVETAGNEEKYGYFRYESEIQCFIIYDHVKDRDCMMIPREFVKSIRHIDTE